MEKYILFYILLLSVQISAQSLMEFDSIAKSIILNEDRTQEDVDHILDLVDNINTPPETQVILLNELRKTKEWNHPKLEPYRLLDSALLYYNSASYEEALPFFLKHVTEGDKKKQVFSLNQSLGLVRSCFKDNNEARLDFYQEKLDYYLENGPFENTATCYHGIASTYMLKANYSLAIRYYLKAAEVYKEFDKVNYGNELAVIGYNYASWGNKIKAREYLEKSIPVLKDVGYFAVECYALNGLINIYREQNYMDKAFSRLEEVFQIYEDYPYPLDREMIGAKIVSIQEKLNFYLDKEELVEAENLIHELESLGDSVNIRMKHNFGFYEIDYAKYRYNLLLGNMDLAEHYLLEAMSQARENRLSAMEVKYLKEAVIFFHQIDKSQKSSSYSREFISLSDSIDTQNSQNLLATYEFEKLDIDKTIELLNLENQKKENLIYFILFSILFLVIATGLLLRFQHIRKTRKIIELEKQQSENLLLNILPEKVAEELKATGDVTPELIHNVSILFTDFIGFTSFSGKLNSKALLNELNVCFSAFDDIAKKYNVEKIKTIGDAYMAAGGLQGDSIEAARNTVIAAIKMQEFINKRRIDQNTLGKPSLEMRVGIHTGTVTAGVVGKNKFQFDVWGDTVNIASRMEFHGDANQVNVSLYTYQLLNRDPLFTFIPREAIEVKGKGEMIMYFVSFANEDELAVKSS